MTGLLDFGGGVAGVLRFGLAAGVGRVSLRRPIMSFGHRRGGWRIALEDPVD